MGGIERIAVIGAVIGALIAVWSVMAPPLDTTASGIRLSNGRYTLGGAR